jgi:hypothetical protein
MARNQNETKGLHTSAIGAERVRYFQGQLLSEDDFRTEQDYFREKLRRHNRLLHGSGVVCGLEVVADPEAGALAVSVRPGYALGPWGDEICVEETAPLDLTDCTQPTPADYPPGGIGAEPAGAAQELLVQIRYVECESRPVARLADDSAGDAPVWEYSRLRDSFALRCIVKPVPTAGDKQPAPDSKVSACPPSPMDEWIVLAEVQAGATLVIKNDVRKVVANTSKLV